MKNVLWGALFGKVLGALAFVALLLLSFYPAQSRPSSHAPGSSHHGSVSVYLFWTPACPHCAKAKAFLEALAPNEPGIRLRSLELSTNEAHDRAFDVLNKHFKIEPPTVPLIVIGDEVFVGFDKDETTGVELLGAIAACQRVRCPDVTGSIVAREASQLGPDLSMETEGRAAHQPTLPETIWLPLIGKVPTQSLSLPALTIALGAIDGFNPCAMWVLVFLIGLLVGMKDPVRMWSYGAVFLLTSAIVYFAFMAAWLNVFLLLGAIGIIRMAVGIFAIGAGGYYLWQFLNNPDAACAVTSPGERQRVMTRFKDALAERSFLAAIAGIVVLAAVVNLIELLCSAGIPAVYTQVLALSELSTSAYFAYLMLYVSVFLLDDIVVFVTAMVTVRATGLAGSYARYSHLIGGLILSGIGLLLIFRPEWLTFA
jgi:glutaredoxin